MESHLSYSVACKNLIISDGFKNNGIGGKSINSTFVLKLEILLDNQPRGDPLNKLNSIFY